MATLTPCRVSTIDRVSLLNVTELSEHSVSNHPMNSFAPFHRYLVQEQNISLRIMASPLASRLACSLSRIEFVSYGLLFHLQLLSTPHYCDAVTFGYRPGNFGRTGLSPTNTVRSKAHVRRSLDRHFNQGRRQAATKKESRRDERIQPRVEPPASRRVRDGTLGKIDITTI